MLQWSKISNKNIMARYFVGRSCNDKNGSWNYTLRQQQKQVP